MKKSLLFLATMLLSMGGAHAAVYEKVTAAPDDWSGTYIVVYENSETEGYVMTAKDAATNYTTTIISGSTITADNLAANEIIVSTYDKGYSLDMGGKYLSGTTNSNKLNLYDEPEVNTFSVNSDGIDITSNTSVLRFNATKGNMRFRYFKSSSYTSMAAIQLYRKQGSTEILHVESVSLSQTAASVSVGNQVQLFATVLPTNAHNTRVSWSTSDEKIATVNTEGLVTAVAEGEATITVTTLDGDKTVTCTITVTPKVLDSYYKMTTLDSLQAGDIIVLVNELNSVVAGSVASTSKYLSPMACTLNDGILAADEPLEITLGVSGDAWTLTCQKGLIGATKTNELTFGKASASNTWTIAFDTDGNVQIVNTNSAYGTIMYNPSGQGSFRNYVSTIAPIAIQLYRKPRPQKVEPLPQLAAPQFSIESGEVETGTQVTIAAGEGDTLYYKIGSAQWAWAITSTTLTLTEDVTIQAYAGREGYTQSERVQATYTIKQPDTPEGLDDIMQDNADVRKVVYEGQIYIITPNGTYTIDGKIVE